MKSRLTPIKSWGPIDLTQLGHPVKRLEADSRRIRPGDVFLAYPGLHVDGRDHIHNALMSGAAAVLWDDTDGFIWNPRWQAPNLPVEHLRDRIGILAAQIYAHPSRTLRVIGITGTNGKTSVSHWLAQAFSLLGQKTAMIGTLGNGFYGELTETNHTTPDPLFIQQELAKYRRQGAHVVSMEVSSHSLDQGRVNGVDFVTAVLTNLTHDHLDYHGSMKAYGEAKKKLFFWEGLKYAVINIDDDFGRQLVTEIDTTETQVVTYGLEQGDVRPLTLAATRDGLELKVATSWGITNVRASLMGRFNAENLLACLATLCVNGVSLHNAATILSEIQPARGRMQRVSGPHEPLVVVDYAHTPDALRKALLALSEIIPAGGRLLCVFGCGGDRDPGKRPMMGAIVAKMADLGVLTSDNPRTEDPQAILHDVLAGMDMTRTHVEVDREAAIHWAVRQASVCDVVLVAGKGHEEYQDIAGVKHPFSDFRVIADALIAWGKRA